MGSCYSIFSFLTYMVIKYCICGTATLPEHPSSSTGFNWVLVIKSLVFCVLYCRSLFSFVLFMCAHVFPVRLQYTVSDYPYGIFNFFVYGRITTGIYTHWATLCTIFLSNVHWRYWWQCYNTCLTIYTYINLWRSRRGGDRMVFGFTTTYAISTYHH
jgi:hypothetical protein